MANQTQADPKVISFISNSDQRVSNHTAEWIHATGANHWKGWYCAAGKQSLYIDFDGNVFVGSCAVGGWYGNIFRQGLAVDKKLNQWIQCTAKACQCGADMFAVKVKNKNFIPDRIEDLYRPIEKGTAYDKIEKVENPDVVFSEITKTSKIVIWDLGRRCNYACTYCFPDSHNNYEAHKSLGSLKHAIDGLTDWWLGDMVGKFVITGGEPTLNPDYLDFVKYIKSKNRRHTVHTTTNGSRDAQYFRELMFLSDITFSGHTESLANPRTYERFVANVRACVELKCSSEIAKSRFLQVRIMLKPGTLDLVLKLMEDLRAIPLFSENVILNCGLLHQTGDKSQMTPYSEKETGFANANA